ncbi:hypothetical protein D7B24_005534 [Verticillium nonalfalfae]|uniref:LrgB-like protein n=1 Tax=Verticillium nonalfalfae TaxID=1051616 RepID=A0A3M9YDA1_9PEZI|nr:uncharacterized protein D7B24_005534 [Verticillium nonalfalfae]RNJ57892.1 hypothetical protein D7B24_005534 [Verticillium nonalfalfae]
MRSKRSTWKVLGLSATRKLGEIFWVIAICVLSEILIWCLSLALRLIDIQFLSAIVGMVMVFVFMLALSRFCDSTERFYMTRIKSKIDFINKNLGVGFPVPIVAISREESLGAKGIGKVIGNFLSTNIIFWVLVFLLAWAFVAGMLHFPRRPLPSSVSEHDPVSTEGEKTPWSSIQAQPVQVPVSEQPPRLELPADVGCRPSDTMTLRDSMMEYLTDDREELGSEIQASSNSPESDDHKIDSPKPECPTVTRESLDQQSPHPWTAPTEQHREHVGQQWLVALQRSYSFLLPAGFLVVLGIPVSVATGDNRILDGCMLWFVWVSAGKLQMALSDENLLSRTPRMPKAVMLVLTTLMNPVLITILLMMAYTRAKAAATSTPLFDLLGEFSSGTNLSDLWSHIVDQYRLNQHQPNHFGAGDGALAILECGIVVWGFKLYECRAQLASRAGLAVCIVSTVSAAINVFVSTLLAKAFGLAPPEALAFAARCTTLALARPAMDSLGGNQVINAALVVSNGIFGQLMYPFALKRLGIPADEPSSTNLETVDSNTDGARTIAAGTAIGINGAAMGVSYLYQQRSRAAPYSVLSMTVFGVMTVVFTGIQPSVKTLKALVA